MPIKGSKSPKENAKDHKGKVMTGTYGSMWKSKKSKNGRYRWVVYTPGNKGHVKTKIKKSNKKSQKKKSFGSRRRRRRRSRRSRK